MEPAELSDERPRTPGRPGRRRRRLRVSSSVALIVALLAAFGALVLWRSGPGVTLATLSWQTYHDPLGLFSVRLPPGWTATVLMGGGVSNDNRIQFDSGVDESVTFSDPTLGEASASFSVDAQPISNPALAQTMECSTPFPVDATFNGYPAEEGDTAVIRFSSATASYQIGEYIPGVLQPDNFAHYTPPVAPTPTPLPALTVAGDRALLYNALASFRPTDPHPLACP